MLHFINDSPTIKELQMQDRMHHNLYQSNFLFACGPKRYASQLKKDKMSANVTVNALSCIDIVEKFILLNAVKSRQMKIMSVFQ